MAHNSIRRQEYFPTDERAASRISMPVVAPQQLNARAAARLATHEPSQRCRVLIVDDDELIVCRVASLLERSGYEVFAARSGEDAMRVLNAMTCHIVVTDWQMPDMNGLELCRDIRSRIDKAYIYVLMLTVRNGSGDILSALSAGADDYAVKGATAEELLARLEVGRRLI